LKREKEKGGRRKEKRKRKREKEKEKDFLVPVSRFVNSISPRSIFIGPTHQEGTSEKEEKEKRGVKRS
jgi:hypothetical protein